MPRGNGNHTGASTGDGPWEGIAAGGRPTGMVDRRTLMAGAAAAVLLKPAAALCEETMKEPPYFKEAVANGKLPPVAQRLPAQPLRSTQYVEAGPGRSGGTLTMLVTSPSDVRLMTVYGYARLIAYDSGFRLGPDILRDFQVSEGRIFTLSLRPGHKWSDGHPFTTADFRYWWEDVANNADISPKGPSQELLVDGKPPKVEVVDTVTIRYTWDAPNPYFAEALARAAPLFIFRPAHYLKQFHARYAEPEALAKAVADNKARNWAALHQRRDVMYRNDNPDLPSLNPWIGTTRGTSERYVFVRNPYFHRIDGDGMQLPYADRVVLAVTAAGLIPTKAGLGESDLQARYLRFADYTFLRKGAKQYQFDVRLWESGNGAQVAFFPNLTTNDPAWRSVVRDVRFRRALSLAIDRDEVAEIVYSGLATPSNNTVRPSSPLFRDEYRTKFTTHDPATANRLLNEMGLARRDSRGTRLLPDGQPANIVIETAGESAEESDVLRLVIDYWAKIGLRTVVKQQTRENLRLRVFSGAAVMSIWTGIENASAGPESSPRELAPTSLGDLQWSKWGQFFETGGQSGERCDMPVVAGLLDLLRQWERTADVAEQTRVWHAMLALHADQQFSIGVISGVQQPVVVRNGIRNVPSKAIYAWHPAAFFGVYRPDLFWIDR